MNKLNVFYNNMCPWKYPSNWPKNFKVFFRQFKWAYQRITKGYCDYDWWDMDTHLTVLIADMLDELAENGIGYPGTDEFPTFESWKEYLKKTIYLLRYSQTELPNEYEEVWMNTWEKDTVPRKKTPEEEEITKNYLNKVTSNEKKQRAAADEGLWRVIHVFHNLWD